MIRKLKSATLLLIVISFGLLWISNPNEINYLKKISVEYSKFHSQTKISHDVLRNIGLRKRDNYVLFSTYSYKFGRLTFYYFGIANRVYSLGSMIDEEEVPLKSVKANSPKYILTSTIFNSVA